MSHLKHALSQCPCVCFCRLTGAVPALSKLDCLPRSCLSLGHLCVLLSQLQFVSRFSVEKANGYRIYSAGYPAPCSAYKIETACNYFGPTCKYDYFSAVCETNSKYYNSFSPIMCLNLPTCSYTSALLNVLILGRTLRYDSLLHGRHGLAELR